MQNADANKVKLVNIDEIVKSKSPKLYKFIPKFLLSYLKKITHQDGVINYMIANHSDKEPHVFSTICLNHFGAVRKVEGIENLPKGDGRMIFVSNHPLGGLDGMAFIEAVHKIYGDLKFPVNDLLLNVPALKKAFIPINNTGGKQTREALLGLEQALDSDMPVLYFPAGMCSRKIKGEITDLRWKKNFLAQAVKHKRNVVPVYISGKNSDFFYNLSNIRTKLGLKFNVEMLYLVNEMVKQKDKELIIKFGKPISFETFDNTKSINDWVEYVRQQTYSMK